MTTPRRSGRPAARAACAWSIAFLVPHVYWAAGGTAGLPGGERLEGAIALINHAAIVLSVVAAGLALALARPPASVARRRILVAGAWTAAVLLGVRGAGGLAQGLLEGGEWSDAGSDALVIGFEALFLLGGILFGLAAREGGQVSTATGSGGAAPSSVCRCTTGQAPSRQTP